ncbi:hypothetical protein BKA62DRAFT_763736 [Auriculariales sp. MPI-PUGE-AT-0066]|nr:hypothetical protein BKA62DRAFT_763736 [Auriculariales sp. MPI-PUGE-AT-0066]
MTGLRDALTQLPSLTTLTILQSDGEEDTHALLRAVSLQLTDLCLLGFPEGSADEPLVFPRLRSLTLNDSFDLHHFRAPALQRLALDLGNLNNDVLSATQHVASVKHLQIWGAVDFENLVLLQDLRQISRLTFAVAVEVGWIWKESYHLSANLFQDLSAVVPPMWPLLKRIDFCSMDTRSTSSQSHEGLLKFIASRQNRGNALATEPTVAEYRKCIWTTTTTERRKCVYKYPLKVGTSFNGSGKESVRSRRTANGAQHRSTESTKAGHHATSEVKRCSEDNVGLLQARALGAWTQGQLVASRSVECWGDGWGVVNAGGGDGGVGVRVRGRAIAGDGAGRNVSMLVFSVNIPIRRRMGQRRDPTRGPRSCDVRNDRHAHINDWPSLDETRGFAQVTTFDELGGAKLLQWFDSIENRDSLTATLTTDLEDGTERGGVRRKRRANGAGVGIVVLDGRGASQ